MSLDFLKRYQSGEYNAWDELVELAPNAESSPELYAQAVSIAEEMMLRVKANTTTLRQTLITAGARIEKSGSPLVPQDYEFLTDRFGPLPLALDVFYRTIGSIDLIPSHDYNYGEVTLEEVDGIWLIALDPLQVASAVLFEYEVEEYMEEDDDEFPFELSFSPDFLHKQDISGGMPYSVFLPPPTPQDALDPLVQNERHDLSFVNYLRYCFRWGGFPGLDVMEMKDEEIDLNWRIGYEDVSGPWRPAYERMLQALRNGLVEF